jgi:hypothetical protein
MKAKQNILKALAIAATISLSTTAATAHTNHDHSTVAYNWEMSKNLKSKLVRQINSESPSGLIGLNHFEQKKLDHYDIKVGNKFNTGMRGINILMERTSAGIKMVDANRAEKVAYRDLVPIKKINMASKVSMNHQPHIGHDHAHLPYEWTFGLETQGKIVKTMSQNEKDVYVGLNQFEQSLLKEYEIKPGNTFQTTIAGHQFLVEKTSSGIKVINHVEGQNVAMAPQNNSKM